MMIYRSINVLYYSNMTFLQFSFLKLVDQHLILIMALLLSMELIGTLTLVSAPFNNSSVCLFN